MEDLVNPFDSDIKNKVYIIFNDGENCSNQGIFFVETEDWNFNIKDKINKLDAIIANLLTKVIETPNQENRENLIKKKKKKKNILADILKQYNELEKNYIEFDKYHRENLFEFYKNKYQNAWFFDVAEKRMYLSIIKNIEIIIGNKFDEFCKDYVKIRNSFFEINNYIIKLKKLYNIQTQIDLTNV